VLEVVELFVFCANANWPMLNTKMSASRTENFFVTWFSP
jgi:hypothetical protein